MFKCLYLAFGVICSSQPAPTAQQAADILRAHAWKPSFTEALVPHFPVVIVTPTPSAPPVQTTESEQGRANRMGIPGGWTPLEWAILHSSK